MSKEKKIITISNEELPISQCRKFDNGYYKIGNPAIENSGDCYLVDGKYYRIETGQVVFDYETQRHVLKSSTIVHGIVGLEENGYKLGHFSLTEDNLYVNTHNGKYFAFREDIFANSRLYRERMSNGEYYHIDLLDAREFTKLKKPDQSYKTSLPYDSRNVLKDYIERYNKVKVSPNKYINNYAEILENLTFGLEFETVEGIVPSRLLSKTGLIPLRDGSIAGIEYVTVPMQGAKGLQVVTDAVKLLEERTRYDETCALHLHLGGMPRTMEWILAFFRLTCHLQDSIFEMFPIYKKYNFGVKNKNYSKPYPIYELVSLMDPSITPNNIVKNFDVLYSYLSMGQSFAQVGNSLDNIQSHPADSGNTAKWNIRTRYYNHNLIPLIFGNKATVEFRIHTPTFDPNKIVPFIILNSILVNFTTKYQDKILRDPQFLLQFHIKSVVTEMIRNHSNIPNINTLHESLLRYIDDRRQHTEDQNRKGLIKGREETIPKCRSIDWGYMKPVRKEVITVSKKSAAETIRPYQELQEQAQAKLQSYLESQSGYRGYIKRTAPPSVKYDSSVERKSAEAWANMVMDLSLPDSLSNVIATGINPVDPDSSTSSVNLSEDSVIPTNDTINKW